ncbi:MAG: SRPBCC family protein [Saprospiraceae bacterium]|nr:SRPBCC family protein [Saprospiraceae bacterium]
MKIYQLKRTQQLNTSIREAWDFFSSPENLKLITPDYLGFEITSDLGHGKMYTGQIITYHVRPIAGIKLNWATEITHVEEPYSFIDVQLEGPYKVWHHQHHFIENEEGVLMKDIVTYALPWYAFGGISNKLIVRKKLEEIFNYRYMAAEKQFNKKNKKNPILT